jgi:hypothetical protein
MSGTIISAAEKLACAQRELSMRRKVYPRWVLNGKMPRSKMDHEIRIMAEIVVDYERQVQEEHLL